MLEIEPTNSRPRKPYEEQKPPERVMTRTNKDDRIQNLTNPLPIKRKEKNSVVHVRKASEKEKRESKRG